MASYGPFLSDNNKYIDFTYHITTNSQDISNNTSNVTVKVTARRNNTGYTTQFSHGTFKLKIDGKEYTKDFDTTFKLTHNSNTELFKKTVDVKHDADGSKNLIVQFYSKTRNGNFEVAYSSSKQASCNLSTIPRASSISSLSYSAAGSSGSNLGTTSLSISRKSDKFKHKVVYTLGSKSSTVNDVGTSHSFNVPLSWASEMPSSTSATLTAKVTTYSGSTKIGSTVSKTCKVSIPSWVKPTISGVTETFSGSKIVGKGNVTYKVDGATAGSGSSIDKYKFVCSNLSINTTQSGNSYKWSYNKAGTFTFTCYAIDKRGRTSSGISKSVTIQDYYPPKFTGLDVRRCNSNGEYKEDGTYFQVRCNYSLCSSATLKKIEIDILSNNSSPIIYSTTTLASNVWSTAYGSGNLSSTVSYIVTVTITDNHNGSSKLNKTLSSLFVPIDFYKTGVGIGGMALEDGFLDVHIGARFAKDIAFDLAGGDNGNHWIWFTNLTYTKPDTGTYGHRTRIGGGDSESQAAFQVHDTVNNHYPIRYFDSGSNPSITLANTSAIFDMYTSSISGSQTDFKYTPISTENQKGRQIRIWREKGSENPASGGRTVLMCTTNGKASFGSASYRWYSGYFNNVYNSSGVLTTSDEKDKNTIEDLDTQIAVKMVQKLDAKTYKLNEGNSGRKHMGILAQDVWKKFNEIMPDNAVCCAQYVDEENEFERTYQEGDEYNNEDKLQWSTRYTELLAPVLKTLQFILKFLNIPDLSELDSLNDEELKNKILNALGKLNN